VILTDSGGNTGLGEVHGGQRYQKILEAQADAVIGSESGVWRKTMERIRGSIYGKRRATGGYERVKTDAVAPECAIESALLDLCGKHAGLPVCELIGAGKQRDEVVVLGYLFFAADKDKAGEMAYIDESGSRDAWYRLRRQEMMTPERIVQQAKAVREKYGMKDFKLKGGVLRGEEEADAVRALKEAFPDARINLDPNCAWSLDEAVRLCLEIKPYITYIEDPCHADGDYSERETMAEFKMATGIPVATNMIVTDWRQLHHGVSLRAFDIVLADVHFWGLDGSARCGQLLADWGLTWGGHSNNHYDISLAMYAHAAAACPGEINSMDTHWIWQEGQELCGDAMIIKDGKIKIPDKPGLGVTIDMDRVAKANELYNNLPFFDRNDAVGMQYLIPGWSFDTNRPCMVRD